MTLSWKKKRRIYHHTHSNFILIILLNLCLFIPLCPCCMCCLFVHTNICFKRLFEIPSMLYLHPFHTHTPPVFLSFPTPLPLSLNSTSLTKVLISFVFSPLLIAFTLVMLVLQVKFRPFDDDDIGQTKIWRRLEGGEMYF